MTCAICLGDLSEGQEDLAFAPMYLPCAHVVHAYCIQRAAAVGRESQREPRCPLCKTPCEVEEPLAASRVEDGIACVLESPVGAEEAASHSGLAAHAGTEVAAFANGEGKAPARPRKRRRLQAKHFRIPRSQGGDFRRLPPLTGRQDYQPLLEPSQLAVPAEVKSPQADAPVLYKDGGAGSSSCATGAVVPWSQVDAPDASQDAVAEFMPCKASEVFRFRFSAQSSRSEEEERTADPVSECISALRASRTSAQLDAAMHSPDLFKGFADEDEAYDTTQRVLKSIVEDTRTHRDLCEDAQFSLRDVSPLPMAKALHTIALQEGWSNECVYQEVKVCTAFTEHPGTRLVLRTTDSHGRTPCIAALRAAEASARKTSLDEFGTSLLTRSRGAPAAFKDRLFIAADATVRGLRDAVLATSACAIISSEVSTTYRTPYSEQGDGLQYLQRPVMCKYMNCEADDNLTGRSGTHLSTYRFLHKVSGQTEAVEWVWAPAVHGFHKRPDVTISCAHPACFEEQPALQSKELVRNLFEFLFAHADPAPQLRRPDPHALTLYRAVARAVDDFVASADASKIGRWGETKLHFKDTDILRNASVAARWCEFLECTYAPPPRLRARLMLSGAGCRGTRLTCSRWCTACERGYGSCTTTCCITVGMRRGSRLAGPNVRATSALHLRTPGGPSLVHGSPWR